MSDAQRAWLLLERQRHVDAGRKDLVKAVDAQLKDLGLETAQAAPAPESAVKPRPRKATAKR